MEGKQTKNTITREWVEKELWFYNNADIKSSLVSGGLISLLFLPITVLLIYGICKTIDHIFFKIIIVLIVGFFVSLPITIKLFVLMSAIGERRLLKRGEFDIVTRDVRYKCDRLVGRVIYEYLCFDDFGEVAVDKTVYNLASQGDMFYIVHYKNRKSSKLLYSSKTHEYK